MVCKFSNAFEPVNVILEFNEFGLEPIPDVQCTFEVVSKCQVSGAFLCFELRPHPGVNMVPEKFNGPGECFIIERLPEPRRISKSRIEGFFTGDDDPWLA